MIDNTEKHAHCDKKLAVRPKILLVDDQEDNLLSLDAVLRCPTLEILKATSGNEALSLLLEHDFAVVLLDVKMPVMDGFETANLIRESRRSQHTPLIFVTAYREASVFQGYGVGAVDYLIKPLDPEIVRSKVRVFVDLYHQRELLAARTQELEALNLELNLVKTNLEASNDELNLAKLAAEKANKAKSEFLAIMTHEIRNPLATIIGYSEMVALYSEDEGVRKNYIQKIYDVSQTLTTLINDLLDLSKAESGMLKIENIRFSPFNCVKEVISLLNPKALHKGLSLQLKTQSDVPADIEGDPTRVKQCLINLIENSIKFTEHGEILITLRLLKATNDRGPLIEILVKDTGCGISEVGQKLLFQPFVQADASITRKYGGTGLGLVLSQKFARALGGDLRLLESTTGKGSVFSFTFDPGSLPMVELKTASLSGTPSLN